MCSYEFIGNCICICVHSNILCATVAIAHADVHHIYNLMLSRLFQPVRTFDLDATTSDNSRQHTSWRDLLPEEGPYDVQEILDHKGTIQGKTEYLVRWQHYTDYWDSWEPEENVL